MERHGFAPRTIDFYHSFSGVDALRITGERDDDNLLILIQSWSAVFSIFSRLAAESLAECAFLSLDCRGCAGGDAGQLVAA